MYILDYNENSTAQYMFLMRDEKEERKKQARSNKQTRQSNTAHPHVQTSYTLNYQTGCIQYSTFHNMTLHDNIGLVSWI